MTEKKNTKFKEAVDQNKTDINIVGESVKEFIEETKTTDSDGVILGGFCQWCVPECQGVGD